VQCRPPAPKQLGRPTLHYRILDAKTGLLEDGLAGVRELRKQQPWDLRM